MPKLLNWKLMAAFTTTALWAQPDVKFDTDQAKVLVALEQPHHRGAMHEHAMNRVQIYLGDGQMALTNPAGKVTKLQFKAGDVRWSPAGGLHISEVVSDRPFQIVEIELKNKPNAAFKSSDLDPLKVDPKHYKLEFENDQVRVLRVHYGAHEKGPRHEHKLNLIVVYLSDQANGKAGTVKMQTPVTHAEENPLDHAVDRIAVELK